MKLIYTKEEVKEQCTSVIAAKKLFGGNVELVSKLLKTIQALESAEVHAVEIMEISNHYE